MEIIDKIVDFEKFCKTCKHCDKKQFEDPCNDCLDSPTNTHTQRPIYYEQDEEKKKEGE